MLPKIICFLFGHKLFTDVFTGEYGEAYNPLTLGTVTVPVVKPVQNGICPRCGKILASPK